MSEPLTPAQRSALSASGCDVRDDDLTRWLYATDASIYSVEPRAVAFPRSGDEVAGVLRAAAASGLPVIPRGAGTGLAGGALGDGLVVDVAHHNRVISDLDPERRTVRVGAGVVLERLNSTLAAHGLWFGPDVATASRATLGGMIANNSSGAHAPVYGTTSDHVEALEIVLADGRVATVGRDLGALGDLRAASERVLRGCEAAVAERLPPVLVKRWPGYGLDRFLREPGDLTRLVAGSEGTLAVITSAVLRVVPRPRRRSLVVYVFDSVAEAMQATVEVLDLSPAAVEHLDRVVFDRTRGQAEFAAARELLGLDDDTCESLLLVELFDDDGSGAETLGRRPLGRRSVACRDVREQELVWAMRRAGLSLATSRPGPEKPATCIEDVCVRPEQLPEYVAGLREIFDGSGLEASFYGHAASGLLHVRPVLDLHTADGVATLRRVADQVSDLVRRFGGSLASEHGVGLARTEYLAEHLGPELIGATRRIKELFDPGGVLNPGKIVDTGRWRIDTDLRQGAGVQTQLPVTGELGFVDRDGSFLGNLEQCNGNGACLKALPTMCPTYQATGDEIMATRGRANTIRGVVEGRFGDPWRALASPELEAALRFCLSCKACKRECPAGVDLAALKAELRHARHLREGVGLTDRVLASADLLGRLGTLLPGLANAALRWRPLRRLLGALLDIDASAPLPPYASQRFDRWFADRAPGRRGSRGEVLLWDDTWVRYHEPHIGRAAVAVLEAAGYRVGLVEGRRCCGRPAASRGLLGEVRRLGAHNLSLPALARGEARVVFLEPSCYSMFVDEYRQLGLPGAEAVADRCVLLEDLLVEHLDAAPGSLTLDGRGIDVAVHVHCHAKALADPGRPAALLERLPGAVVHRLDTGCCGMAGAFGIEQVTRPVSRAVAEPLVAALADLGPEVEVVASGASCRHQIAALSPRRARHLAEILLLALRTVGVAGPEN